MSTRAPEGRWWRRALAWLFPSPFALCIVLTLVVLTAKVAPHCYRAKDWRPEPVLEQAKDILVNGWFRGFCEEKYNAFTFQMGLMLLTGGALARAYYARRLLDAVASRIANSLFPNACAVFVVANLALTTGLINWGFSLIFSGMLAR